MMNALVVRCFALACTLALMVGPASAQQAAPADPAMGQSVEVAAMSDSMVKANQERLQETLRHAAEDYQAARFDRATDWYEQALQIEPDRADIKQALDNTRQMREAKRQALEKLPSDPAQRDQFIRTAYEQAVKLFNNSQYQEAQLAFFNVWLAAGDYRSKTIKYYRKSQQKVAERTAGGQAVAQATDPAATASDAQATTASSTAVAAAVTTQTAIQEAAPAVAIPPAAAKAEASPGAVTSGHAVARSSEPATATLRVAEPSSAAAEIKAAAEASAETEQKLTDAQTAAKLGNYEIARKILEDVLASDKNNVAARAELAKLDELDAAAKAQTEHLKAKQATEQTERAESAPAETAPEAVAPAEPTGTSEAAAPAAKEQTPVTESGSINDVTRLEVNLMLNQAAEKLQAGDKAEAQKLVDAALAKWPGNPRALAMQEKMNQVKPAEAESPAGATQAAATSAPAEQPSAAEGQAGQGGEVTQIQDKLERRRQLDAMHTLALDAYDKADLAKARQTWERMLALDPGNKIAQTWLENTQAEFDRTKADIDARQTAEKRKDEGERLLNAPITISTDHKIPLSEFMTALSIATPSELQFNIAQGADSEVFVNFFQKPLREVLDSVTRDLGLSWSIDQQNVITIHQKLVAKTFSLSPPQMSRVRALMDKGDLQRLIWGQTEPPAKGVEMTLDERESMLILTGSQLQVDKVQDFLNSVKVTEAPDLIFRSYKIREQDGPKIKALINSIIKTEGASAFEYERKVMIDGEDLFIRDTPDNIKKIEDMLLDKEFIQKITKEEVDIRNFSLVPKDIENVKSDQIQAFTARVVEAIKVFLYAKTGVEKANEEGRKLYFDEATLQLTVIDTPTNLERVSEYIESLPEIRKRSTQKVVFLDYAIAEELAPNLSSILELTSGMGGGAGGGEEIMMSLRRGGEGRFRDITVRLVRVTQGGDETDKHSDTAELRFNIPGTGPQSLSITELDVQQIDDYEVTAEDIVPSTSQAGQGSVRLRIRYNPTTGYGNQTTEQQQQQEKQNTVEEQGITINPFGNLNAIIIRYTNANLYQDAMDLIHQLDQPTKQVKIETRFVEVNETRAKEFSNDINLAGLGTGKSVDWDTSTISSRFAQDVDEYRSLFEPPIENPLNSSLLKGSTVIEAVIGDNLEFSLRMLEAEGILNIVNGPQVLALDGQEAQFRIEEYVPDSGTNDITFAGDSVGNATVQSPVINHPEVDLNTTDDGGDAGAVVTAVVLQVTPQITSKNSIILNDLEAELIDPGTWLGEQINPTMITTNPLWHPADTETGTDAGYSGVRVPDVFNNTLRQNNWTLYGANAMSNMNSLWTTKRKRISTDARISNGGTIVIGGWTGERTEELTSGVPVLRNMPFFGKMFFSRNQRSRSKTTLLIFLTGYIVD